MLYKEKLGDNMKFATLNDVLPIAKNRVAVPQFNINGQIWIEAILEVIKENDLPVIIGVTDRNVERLGGYTYIRKNIEILMVEKSIDQQVVLHLDHGESIKSCIKAVDAGFSSVMYDGSSLSIEENIENTKKIVDYAHEHGVSVEAEVGSLGGNEDGLISDLIFADVEECILLANTTNVDALAPALGSSHGPYTGQPDLSFDRMSILNEQITQPLVLHGASGISEKDILKAISLGHAKININTEINQAWADEIRNILMTDKKLHDPKIILEAGKYAIKEVIRKKINLFNHIETNEK